MEKRKKLWIALRISLVSFLVFLILTILTEEMVYLVITGFSIYISAELSREIHYIEKWKILKSIASGDFANYLEHRNGDEIFRVDEDLKRLSKEEIGELKQFIAKFDASNLFSPNKPVVEKLKELINK